jgi:type IV pilus assembly protein PilA
MSARTRNKLPRKDIDMPFSNPVTKSRGFTAIELMIMLLVVAILAAIAVPNYSEQIAAGQVTQAMPLASVAENGVTTQYNVTHQFPANNAAALLPPANFIVSNYVSSVNVDSGGAVTLTFGNQANGRLKGKFLSFRPAVVPAYPQVPIAWICGMANVPAQMTVNGENKTNLTVAELPFSCRAN